ncbi:MAG: PRC-barrel domain-containing protein [Actinomycetales bacterium]
MISINDVGSILAAKTPVHGSDGKIGTVGQVFLDDSSGDPTWLTVNTGLFGTKESFVPLEGSRYEGDEIVVPFDKNKVKDAPRLDVDEALTPDQERELFSHYGLGASYEAGWDRAPEANGEWRPDAGGPDVGGPVAGGPEGGGADRGVRDAGAGGGGGNAAGVGAAGAGAAGVGGGAVGAGALDRDERRPGDVRDGRPPVAPTPDASGTSPQRAADVPAPGEQQVENPSAATVPPIPGTAPGSSGWETATVAPTSPEPASSPGGAPAGTDPAQPTGRVRLRRYTVTETYAEDGTPVTSEDIHIERDPDGGEPGAAPPAPAGVGALGRHARP